jgi:hypothetical protein
MGAQLRRTHTWRCSRRIPLYRQHRLILLHPQYKTLIACLFHTNGIMHVMFHSRTPDDLLNGLEMTVYR